MANIVLGILTPPPPLEHLTTIQHGHNLDFFLQEIVYADPYLGLFYVLKVDVSNGFYCIRIRPRNTPKMDLIVLASEEDEPLVSTPLITPMICKNSPTILCASTETVSDLANNVLHDLCHTQHYPMDYHAERVSIQPFPPLNSFLSAIPRDPMPGCKNADLLAYVEIFVEKFLGLAQGPVHHCWHVCRTIFHSLEQVFHSKDTVDLLEQK